LAPKHLRINIYAKKISDYDLGKLDQDYDVGQLGPAPATVNGDAEITDLSAARGGLSRNQQLHSGLR
jgi:hypothetical protein